MPTNPTTNPTAKPKGNPTTNPTAEKFLEFVQVVSRLRDPNGGCPWDLEQDHRSLRPYVVEETYEVLEAIDSGDDNELKKELGDLLLQVVLHAQVAKDRKAFTIDDVVEYVTDKMIRRHPHVFGDVKVSGSQDVLKNWEQIKQTERLADAAGNSQGGTSNKKPSFLEGVPAALPALLRGQRLGHKAAKANFDWRAVKDVWQKVHEELGELEEELNQIPEVPRGKHPKIEPELKSRLSHELGDILFALCQLARWIDLSAEDSLRECCERFIMRFDKLEEIAPKPLSEMSDVELEAQYQEAKRLLEKIKFDKLA